MSDLKKGSEYKGFYVKKVFELKDFHSTAYEIVHEKTGLTVLHILNDDEENLFSFSFRTANEKSNGAAHIIEHSVLCGSEKFPLKDPFTHLCNQSVKTYLNAMTYPDRTVYPASSTVKADYFNLMSVYADAVFFPLLKKEIFMQEAHRMEIDGKGKLSIQGVVYNEMKGNYSSFDSICFDESTRELLAGSIYEKDSGGDPLEIPSITHEELLDFHKKWYRPENCLLFLYGNIPTEEQLDFIEENFLTRLEKKFAGNKNENILDEYRKYVTPKLPEKLRAPHEVYAIGPAGEGAEKGGSVVLSWNLGASNNAFDSMEKIFLFGILLNHDGSPLQKALLESRLGEDISPVTGLESFYNTVFSVGLRGVKKGNSHKVEETVFSTLENLFENGISKTDIDSTLMSLEFSYREIKRIHGPFSLRFMNAPIQAWAYGNEMENSFKVRSILEKIREKTETEERYIESLIEKYLLKNENYTLVTVTPSKKYGAEREKLEKQMIAAGMKKTTKEEILLQNEKLHQFQSAKEDSSIIPHLSPKDFIDRNTGLPVLPHIRTDYEKIPSADGKGLNLFTNTENTNGVSYISIGFPVDVLLPEDYKYLQLFSDTVLDCGWKNKTWAEVSQTAALETGGFSASLLVNDTSKTERALKFAENKDWIGREWLIIRTKVLDEKIPSALSLFEHFINDVDFSDLERLKDIASETKNSIEASVIPDGSEYAVLRAKRKISRVHAVDEIWNGITQLFSIREQAAAEQEKNAEIFRRIYAELKAGGAFIHITAEKETLEKTKKLLPDFIKNAGLNSLKQAEKVSDEVFIKMTELGENVGESSLPLENSENSGNTEIFTGSLQVGFAAQCAKSSPYGTKNASVEEVCTHWLSNMLLWEKIRTVGGAYGAFCFTEALASILLFSTYRDPNPLLSNDIFLECLKEASERHFTEEEVEKAVTGTYSSFVQPKSPQGRGTTGLLRTLFAISEEDTKQKVLEFLNAKEDDIRKCFKSLYESALKTQQRVIICNKGSQIAGKTISLLI